MDNRSNILSCALRLFATRGYDAVGVQEIVEAAGITKPTLYHYFGSKQGLLDALLKEYFDQLYREVKSASVYRRDLPHTLNQVAKTYFDFANRNKMTFTSATAPSGLALARRTRLRQEQPPGDHVAIPGVCPGSG